MATTRARFGVKGHLGGDVGDGAPALEGDVAGRVAETAVRLGHFGGGVAQGFDLWRGAEQSAWFGERVSVAVVEGASQVLSQLEMLNLVLSHGHMS